MKPMNSSKNKLNSKKCSFLSQYQTYPTLTFWNPDKKFWESTILSNEFLLSVQEFEGMNYNHIYVSFT